MNRALLAILSLSLPSSLAAQHVLINEPGDAGDTPATAWFAHGTGSVHSVVGDLSTPWDVDVIAVRITNPAIFYADSATPTTGLIDTSLYVMDCDGNFLAHNENGPVTSTTAATIGHATAPAALPNLTQPGVYFIAITTRYRKPVNSSGQEIFNHNLITGVSTPNGPGAIDPQLDQWTGTGNSFGNYGIALCGAELLGSNAPSNRTIGFGCGSFDINPLTVPETGGSCDFELTSPTSGLMLAMGRLGTLSSGLLLPAPFDFPCFSYLGNQPANVIGSALPTTSAVFSIPIPPGPTFNGTALTCQGVRLDPATGELQTSNALEATIGTCN